MEKVENQIAKDVSKKAVTQGPQNNQTINIKGKTIEYRSYVKDDGTINVGTYFIVDE